MENYLVLYKTEDMRKNDDPFAFRCQAEDVLHADEQCINAYPDCVIVGTCMTTSYREALQYYYEAAEYEAEYRGPD